VQLHKSFPTFYGTRRFTTVFTKPSTNPYFEPEQSSPYHPILSKIHFNNVLSTHQRLGLPGGLFHSGFPINILYVPFLSHSCCMYCPSHPPEDCQVIKLLLTQFSLTSYHFISLRSKYSPQNPVLKHPQSTFLP
jgi:hypothetical protein